MDFLVPISSTRNGMTLLASRCKRKYKKKKIAVGKYRRRRVGEKELGRGRGARVHSLLSETESVRLGVRYSEEKEERKKEG